MLRAMYTAASGMSAQETNLDNVANNLANSSTTGFRKRRVQFEDMIYQNVVMPGAAATQQTTFAAGLQIGLGTRTATSEVVQLQGDFSATGNPLDLTIQGNGFLSVESDETPAPTRTRQPAGTRGSGDSLRVAVRTSRSTAVRSQPIPVPSPQLPRLRGGGGARRELQHRDLGGFLRAERDRPAPGLPAATPASSSSEWWRPGSSFPPSGTSSNGPSPAWRSASPTGTAAASSSGSAWARCSSPAPDRS